MRDSTYAKLYDTVWRAQNRLSDSPSVALAGRLRASAYLPTEELAELQWRRLKALLRHAYYHVPFYRQRFTHLDIHPDEVRTPADYRSLPPLTRADLQQHQAQLVATNVRPSALIKDSTGGSTGKPVHFHVDSVYRRWIGLMMREQDSWAGLRRGEPHALLWGSKIDLAKQNANLKARLTRQLKRQLFLDCFELDEVSLAQYTAALAKFRPRLLTGYVLALQLLARYIIRAGAEPPQIGAIQTGAEPLRSAQRQIIERGLAAPVFERYGGRDIGAIAHECEAHRGMHIFAYNYYVEVLRDGQPAVPGEPGELVITQLDNYGAPFLRYRSEDIGVLADGPCPCGRTYPRLERVDGRILDLIVGANGRILPGEFFPHFFKDFDIGEFQVVQRSRELLQIKLAGGRTFSADDQRRIEATIKSYLGETTQVEISMVDSIPRTASGKFRVTISEVPSEWLKTE